MAICEAHWSRLKVRLPAFRLGLCRDCFSGRAVRREEGLVRPERPCRIQGRARRIRRDNASGVCFAHQAKGFITEKTRESRAAANRRWQQANEDKVAAANRRYCQANKEKVA